MQSGSGLHCHLFEANEMICNYLGESRQLHRDSRIEIVRAVVTDQPGETRFSINSEALGESTVSEKGGTAVPNVVLDEYIRQHGIETVDFAKMDIEGWEPAALRGARESLRSGILKAIYFEVSPALLSSHGFCPLDALAILRECGYEIFFCKAADRENGVIPAQDWTERRVRNRSMLVAPVLNFPEAISTDLLAVHRSLLP
jgi:FkbM family methyltransferase